MASTKLVTTASGTPHEYGDKYIVVITAVWVIVGDYRGTNDAGFAEYENCAVIRLWGTERGLGELAFGGPTSSTVLDPCGKVEVKENAVILRIPCVKASYNKWKY